MPLTLSNCPSSFSSPTSDQAGLPASRSHRSKQGSYLPHSCQTPYSLAIDPDLLIVPTHTASHIRPIRTLVISNTPGNPSPHDICVRHDKSPSSSPGYLLIWSKLYISYDGSVKSNAGHLRGRKGARVWLWPRTLARIPSLATSDSPLCFTPSLTQ